MHRRLARFVVLGLAGLAVLATVAVGIARSQTATGPGGHVRPGGGAGGTYRGPGDTVPPCPPWCPTPGPPPNCPRTCESDYLGEGCTDCDLNKSPTGFSLITWPQAPPCFQNEFGYFYHITIGDLLTACNNTSDPIATICLNLLRCGNGVDGIFVYETIPFQWFESGLPASNGSHFNTCGMSYGFDVVYSDGYCSEWERGIFPDDDPHYLFNSHCRAYNCASLFSANLQIDCTCLVDLLHTYQALGLYAPGFSPNTWINDQSAAFSIVVKCCQSEEFPVCDPQCDPIPH